MPKKYVWSQLGKSASLINLTAEDLIKILDCYYGEIFVTDSRGTILYTNSGEFFVDMGLACEDIIGKHISRINGIFDRSISQEVLDAGHEIVGYNSDKTGRSIYIHGVPIFDDDDNIMMIVQFSKIGAEIEEFLREIYKSKERIKQYHALLNYITNPKGDVDGLVFRSKIMKQVLRNAERAAITDGHVLLYGESGTGKEVVTKYIHSKSPRSHEVFIPVNCAAIPENLFESEFFGYDRGAFTGSRQEGKPGFFEMANRGTLLLDEIGELPLSIQSKFLRVLETSEVTRIGSIKSKKVDVRIVCATNRNLYEMVQNKQFREDLYYRLNIIQLTLPALRDRKEDIEPLINHFLEFYNRKYNANKQITQTEMKRLTLYQWPGNVRELKNLVHRLVVLSENDMIFDAFNTFADKEPMNSGDYEPVLTEESNDNESHDLKSAVREFEKQYISKILKKTGYNITRTAKILGVNRSYIYRCIGSVGKHIE